MQIERMYYPVKTLGYGNRLGIWMVGCPHRCFNCCNPELQNENVEKELSVNDVFRLIESIGQPIDGVTISGGDPFFQPKELAILVRGLVHLGIEDILVYSGYTMDELISKNDKDTFDILDNIAVLIDGKYMEELNDNRPLRGSSNQQILLLKEKFKDRYINLLGSAREIQNVYFSNNLISIGIPPKGFKKRVRQKSKEKGLFYHK